MLEKYDFIIIPLLKVLSIVAPFALLVIGVVMHNPIVFVLFFIAEIVGLCVFDELRKYFNFGDIGCEDD
ncbi:hypothetical protein [Eubacterium oxidoreducens]|uniref:Uncharacterized protein n=1 Tax=Eubacterium oxidoreducens TaxID=1732 RepID=A0A1G6B242_EUBOX|nr:hypothetical protein [Eubacterium oxidoreducens]SDB14747.1 hypothetical protein SAMN02910417_01075 [Eubacterium oxidoreducens]